MMLNQSELKRVWRYNPETGLFTRLVKTANCTKAGDIANCDDGGGYIRTEVFGKKYRAHRLAFLYITGEWPKNYVDHINGVRNDNRWVNLRDATKSVNQQNQRKPPVNNTSGYMGVIWHKQRGKWRVRIVVNSKQISLGFFDDVHEAGAHYLKKKRELHEGCTI